MTAVIVTLSLCTLGALSLIRRYDLYDKEPWWAMLLAIALGATGMYFIVTPQELFADWVGNAPMRFAMVAALTEESLKAAGVLFMALVARRAFNDPVDGIIYGSLVGLGCALEESVSYFLHPVTRPWGTPTEVIRILGHLIFGGLSGFGIGSLWSCSIPRRLAAAHLVIGFGVAILLHYLWDVQASQGFMRASPTLTDRGAQVGLMLSGFAAYATVLRIAWSRAQLEFKGKHWKQLLRGFSR